MNNICALSFDYDGCIGSNNIIQENTFFFSKIKKRINQIQPSLVVIMLGSNRQSLQTDLHNMRKNQNGSAFLNMTKVWSGFFNNLTIRNEKSIPVCLNTSLLQDLFFKGSPGEANSSAFFTAEYIYKALNIINSYTINDDEHQIALEKIKEKFSTPTQCGYLFEENKALLTYFQMHELASIYPGCKIDYYFFDDKTSILNFLHLYYEQKKQLIPSNITLHLQRYKPSENIEIMAKSAIDGVGLTNSNYFEDLKNLSNYLARYKNALEVNEQELSQLILKGFDPQYCSLNYLDYIRQLYE